MLTRLAHCFLTLLVTTGAFAQQQRPQVALIDTTDGRLTCTLMTGERPTTVARFISLAQGRKPWTAPDGTVQRGKPFYDGNRIVPVEAGISTGTRATAQQKPADATFKPELQPAIPFNKSGQLAMLMKNGEEGPSRFLITDHANTEMTDRAVVFGQCDEASARLVGSMRATLQSTDNHPATTHVINHITILGSGESVPELALAPATAEVMPVQSRAPLAPPSGPEPTGPVAIFETSLGSISCRLFERESPIATATFLGLVDGSKDWTDPRSNTVQHHHRFYDGMPINRDLPDFYIQFGDVTGDISGNTDIGFHFKNEHFPGLTFDRPGRLAFGNGGPDTNSSELFIALNPMHSLDAGFPILGQCDVASLPILDQIAHSPRDENNRPVPPISIKQVIIRAVPLTSKQ